MFWGYIGDCIIGDYDTCRIHKVDTRRLDYGPYSFRIPIYGFLVVRITSLNSTNPSRKPDLSARAPEPRAVQPPNARGVANGLVLGGILLQYSKRIQECALGLHKNVVGLATQT